MIMIVQTKKKLVLNSIIATLGSILDSQLS